MKLNRKNKQRTYSFGRDDSLLKRKIIIPEESYKEKTEYKKRIKKGESEIAQKIVELITLRSETEKNIEFQTTILTNQFEKFKIINDLFRQYYIDAIDKILLNEDIKNSELVQKRSQETKEYNKLYEEYNNNKTVKTMYMLQNYQTSQIVKWIEAFTKLYNKNIKESSTIKIYINDLIKYTNDFIKESKEINSKISNGEKIITKLKRDVEEYDKELVANGYKEGEKQSSEMLYGKHKRRLAMFGTTPF